jgi:hypothetical protein
MSGGWKILPMGEHIRWRSWIVHHCRPATGYKKKTYLLVDAPSRRCPTCDSKVPNEVWEAWRSQNSHMMKYPTMRSL